MCFEIARSAPSLSVPVINVRIIPINAADGTATFTFHYCSLTSCVFMLIFCFAKIPSFGVFYMQDTKYLPFSLCFVYLALFHFILAGKCYCELLGVQGISDICEMQNLAFLGFALKYCFSF